MAFRQRVRPVWHEGDVGQVRMTTTEYGRVWTICAQACFTIRWNHLIDNNLRKINEIGYFSDSAGGGNDLPGAYGPQQLAMTQALAHGGVR